MPDTITAGSLLIKSVLPGKAKDAYDPSALLDKNGVRDLMVNIVKNGGDTAHEAVSSLGSLFFNTATENGYSTPLDDYHNDSTERQTILDEFSTRVSAINEGKGTKLQKAKKLHDLSGKYKSKLQGQNTKYLLGKGSVAAHMAQTGARGNTTQLQQGTASPLMAVDVQGLPIPVAITSSFSEGLTSAEHIAMSYGGRSSTVKTQLATSKPGEVFKKITPNLYHEVVTVDNCNTKNGVWIPVTDSRAIIGRYEAGTDTLITESTYREVNQRRAKKIKMRSTITCEAKEGVCKKCYGITSDGKLADIGENVGVVAAQSISEVLTQAVLSTKHTGGVAGKARSAFDEANNLLRNPTNFINKAIISKHNGKVSAVRKTPLGDTVVTINDEDHFLPADQKMIVKKGQPVTQGQPLTEGTVNPRELVDLRGMGTGRTQFANSLRGIYEDDNHKLDPRHFDLVARNLLKWVEVKKPGDSGYLPGQVVSVNNIAKVLKKDTETVDLAAARGRMLSKGALELTPGTVLDGNHIDHLRAGGVKKVEVSKSDMAIKPLVPGLATAKLKDSNWISRLALTHLNDSIATAAALGEKSEIHSTDPITSYILGTEFGEGKKGRY